MLIVGSRVEDVKKRESQESLKASGEFPKIEKRKKIIKKYFKFLGIERELIAEKVLQMLKNVLYANSLYLIIKILRTFST